MPERMGDLAVDSAEAYEAYRASELVDRAAFDRYIKLQSRGFEAYHRCYAREAGNPDFYAPLRDQAQAVADRLQRSQ